MYPVIPLDMAGGVFQMMLYFGAAVAAFWSIFLGTHS